MTRYGVTWATADHSVAQTGYVYATIEAAEAVACKGPDAVTQVDAMCCHDAHEGEPLYGLVHTEDDNILEVEVRA